MVKMRSNSHKTRICLMMLIRNQIRGRNQAEPAPAPSSRVRAVVKAKFKRLFICPNYIYVYIYEAAP